MQHAQLKQFVVKPIFRREGSVYVCIVYSISLYKHVEQYYISYLDYVHVVVICIVYDVWQFPDQMIHSSMPSRCQLERCSFFHTCVVCADMSVGFCFCVTIAVL